jgi:hypothetical protein
MTENISEKKSVDRPFNPRSRQAANGRAREHKQSLLLLRRCRRTVPHGLRSWLKGLMRSTAVETIYSEGAGRHLLKA